MNESTRMTEEQFKEWAISQLNIDFASYQYQQGYENSVQSLLRSATRHKFFRELGVHLKKWEQSYVGDGRFSLYTLATDEDDIPLVPLQPKTYSSMVNKAYRYNCINNSNFGKNEPPYYSWSPINGWLTPNNWFQVINDTVRTMIICKYIDGPKYLAEKLEVWAVDCELEKRVASREKEEGYYAYHLYVKLPAAVHESGQFVERNVEVEIQLTTQLQEALYQVAHRQYEQSRIEVKSKEDNDRWKWDYKAQKFRIGYMSHTLHMLEAFILDIRDDKPSP